MAAALHEGEEEPVTNAGGVAEGEEATCTGGAAGGDGEGGDEGTCDEELHCMKRPQAGGSYPATVALHEEAAGMGAGVRSQGVLPNNG